MASVAFLPAKLTARVKMHVNSSTPDCWKGLAKSQSLRRLIVSKVILRLHKSCQNRLSLSTLWRCTAVVFDAGLDARVIVPAQRSSRLKPDSVLVQTRSPSWYKPATIHRLRVSCFVCVMRVFLDRKGLGELLRLYPELCIPGIPNPKPYTPNPTP